MNNDPRFIIMLPFVAKELHGRPVKFDFLGEDGQPLKDVGILEIRTLRNGKHRASILSEVFPDPYPRFRQDVIHLTQYHVDRIQCDPTLQDTFVLDAR